MQAVIRDRMLARTEEELAAASGTCTACSSASARPGRSMTRRSWPRFRLIWPHLRAVRGDVLRGGGGPPAAHRPGALPAAARRPGPRAAGGPARSSRTGCKCWRRSPTRPWPTPLRVQLLRLRFNLANILRDLAKFDESRELDRRCWPTRRTCLAPGIRTTLMTRSSLAADLRALGQYRRGPGARPETYTRGRTTARTRRHPVGRQQPGRVLRLTGRFLARSSSDRGHARAALGRPRTRAPEDPGLRATSARDLLEAGSYAEVVTEMERRLDRLPEGSRVMTTGPPSTPGPLFGVALRIAGGQKDAEDHISTAMEGLIRGFGHASSDALACRLSHAAQPGWPSTGPARLTGRHRRSCRCTRSAWAPVTRIRSAAGSTSPPACTWRKITGAALIAARAAAAGMEGVLGPDHPYTLAANMVLAVCAGRPGATPWTRRLSRATLTAQALERVLGPAASGHATMLGRTCCLPGMSRG